VDLRRGASTGGDFLDAHEDIYGASEAVNRQPGGRARGMARTTTSPRLGWLDEIAQDIDWDAAPDQLASGDLSKLDQKTARAIREAAGWSDIVAEAKGLALEPIVFVIGLAAEAASERSRSAARVAKAILAGKDPAGLAQALGRLGLVPFSKA